MYQRKHPIQSIKQDKNGKKEAGSKQEKNPATALEMFCIFKSLIQEISHKAKAELD